MDRPSDPITVLHVDDEPGFTEMAKVFVERDAERTTVETATSAAEALEYLADAAVDCVVSDYDMPGRNGIEFLEAVRADHPDLPFILFTGKGSEEVASDAISAGVTDYLQKATSTDQYRVLANRIGNVVEQYRAERMVDRAFQAMDRSREGMALLDDAGTFVYLNDAYADIVDYQVDELEGAHWTSLFPTDQSERLQTDVLRTVRSDGRWSGETVYERRNGSRVVVDHVLADSSGGTLICLATAVADADANRALHAERQRFELLIEGVTDYAIFMLDPAGHVTSWNAGAERLKGYTEDEILGRHFSTFYTDDQREADLPEQLLERALQEGSVEHRGSRVRKDGSTFPAKVVITAVFDRDGTHRGFGKVTENTAEDGT